MKSILIYIKNKLTFLVAIMLSAVVGGATVALVSAAIPDNKGQINACYRTNGGDLRLIDTTNPTDICSNKETALSWDKNGENSFAFVTIKEDPASAGEYILDTVHSRGVNEIKILNCANVADPGAFECPNSSKFGICIKFDFEPKFFIPVDGTSLELDSTQLEDTYCGAGYHARVDYAVAKVAVQK